MGICCGLLDPQTNSYAAEVCWSNMYSRPLGKHVPIVCQEAHSPVLLQVAASPKVPPL